MNQIRTRVVISADRRISGKVPDDVPPGEHEVVMTIVPSPVPKRFRLEDMSAHDTPWDDSISLHREEMYSDDGR